MGTLKKVLDELAREFAYEKVLPFLKENRDTCFTRHDIAMVFETSESFTHMALMVLHDELIGMRRRVISGGKVYYNYGPT